MPDKFERAAKLLEKLEAKGVQLWRENDKIKYKASTGIMQNEDILQLKEYKGEILKILEDDKGTVRITEDKAGRYEPFVLTDVQQSYLMGRSDLFEYGGTACHIYLQLNYENLDVKRVESVWNYLISKHEMLRTVIYKEGYQQILKDAPHFYVKDYHDRDVRSIENELGHEQFEIGKWPYFSVAVSDSENGSVLHFSIEFIIADWTSIWMLLSQFEKLYFGEISEISDIDVSFRDYVIAEQKMKKTRSYEKDKKYWTDKLNDFPARPMLDVITGQERGEVRFERKCVRFSPDEWNKIKNYALENGLTPTTLVMMIYAAALERYSQNKRFAINLTLLNRHPFHADINKVAGDFTSLFLLDIDFENELSFLDNARSTGEKLFEGIDHNCYSGVEFMREISRRNGSDAAFMPYVFTSAVGLSSSMKDDLVRGQMSGSGISQTPQVFIDCQVMDGSFGMQVNWDIRKGVFSDSMTEDMFALFSEILHSIIKGQLVLPDYPSYQKLIFVEANNTEKPFNDKLLHEGIMESAGKFPDRTAVVAGDRSYTYSEMMSLSGDICSELMKSGVKKGEPVGIAAGKSVYQPSSAIAVLCAGGIYVPVSVEQGEKRIESIIKRAGIKVILTDSADKTMYPENVNVIRADTLVHDEGFVLPEIKERSASDPAYIIFTSGSTGEPKGVVISHRGAVNTIKDINEKYGVTENDRVLGVSQFSFDLSVYDIFGVLGVGGKLVYPTDAQKKDPAYLVSLIQQNGITIWNSVPSLLRMIMVYLESEKNKPDISSIRLALLSGDWIPVDLPEKFLGYSGSGKVVSLGGATEASIWSIYHDYDGLCEGFNSIPYGRPLANQHFRILDSHLRDCPAGVKGDIYILGAGLADGYYNDPEKTAAQFFKHPADGVMMYKTGDIGKYHNNGEIEFLGRSDSQIKFNGHRIELGEIESAVNKVDGVSGNKVVYKKNDDEKRLICFYETEYSDDQLHLDNKNRTKKNITEREIREEIRSYLPVYMIPSVFCMIDEIPLTSNGKADIRKLEKIAEKQLVTVNEADNSAVSEDGLTELQIKINEILSDSGIRNAGFNDSFYNFGADSLIIAQITGNLRKSVAENIAFDELLRFILNHPTLAQVSEYINDNN